MIFPKPLVILGFIFIAAGISAGVYDMYRKEKKSSVEIDPVEEYLIKELAGSKKEPTPEQEKDAEDLFCLSIVPTLKRLPPKKRQLAKLKIQQLLFDLEFGDSDS